MSSPPTPSPPSTPSRFSPVAFLVEPAREFAGLAAAPRFAAPVLAWVLGTLVLHLAYYGRVDLAWFRDSLAASNPAVARALAGAPSALDRGVLLWPTSLAAALGAVAVWLGTAAYVRFVAAALRRPGAWTDALALAAWAGLPNAIALLPAALNLALHPDGRLAPEQLDPTTFAMLLGVPAGAGAGLAAQVGVFSVWAWALLALGLRVNLRLRAWQAIALVAGPVAVILGLQAAAVALLGG